MSLWMVVWMSGYIGGVAGPLPYGKAECLSLQNEANSQIAAQIATGKDRDGNPVTEQARSLRWECVEAAERPVMNYPQKEPRP